MTEIQNAILDAAEARIRKGGYGAFSFREIAADVGIKSSSVHYHFPAKEDLAAAVIRRYSDYVVEEIDRRLEDESDPKKVWAEALGGTVHTKCMCPGTMLGAMNGDLPPKVQLEVKRFFQLHLDKATEAGLSPDEAMELVSMTMGAMVVANALGDASIYDRASNEYLRNAAKAA